MYQQIGRNERSLVGVVSEKSLDDGMGDAMMDMGLSERGERNEETESRKVRVLLLLS